MPAATKKTIDVLLKKADTKDCQKADVELMKLTELTLIGEKISDIKPLAGLTNLTVLRLEENEISDIKPLAGLTNIES